VPVEVGLLFSEQVQVILAAHFVIFPAVPGEETRPVVRRIPVSPGAPDIIVAVRAAFIAAFLKPWMFVGGMVDNEIHNYFDIAFAGLIDESVHIGHRTEVRVDAAVIAYIIAVIGVRGGINGAI
jgi:hypothetical protein